MSWTYHSRETHPRSIQNARLQPAGFSFISVLLNGWIDICCPGEDSTSDVVDIGKALVHQKSGDVGGALATSTHHEDFRIRVKLLNALRDVVHRDVEGSRHACDFDFKRLSDIEEDEVIPGIQL